MEQENWRRMARGMEGDFKKNKTKLQLYKLPAKKTENILIKFIKNSSFCLQTHVQFGYSWELKRKGEPLKGSLLVCIPQRMGISIYSYQGINYPRCRAEAALSDGTFQWRMGQVYQLPQLPSCFQAHLQGILKMLRSRSSLHQ